MMRARRPRLVGLVAAIAITLAGPWTAAHADDWPHPDPGYGVILADMRVHSAAGVGFRFTLKKQGEVDFLHWAGLAVATKSDQGIADGIAIWDVRTPGSPLYYGYGDTSAPTSDFFLKANGTTVVDSRGGSSGESVDDITRFFRLPAGTYDLVLWTASNAPHLESRFRLRAAKGTKLVRRIVSTRTFRLVQRAFSGTASASAKYQTFGGVAMVDETTHLAVRNEFYGGFSLPNEVLAAPSVGSYSGPTGTHQVQGDELFAGAPAGTYTFTVDAGVGWEPLVAGVDIGAP